MTPDPNLERWKRAVIHIESAAESAGWQRRLDEMIERVRELKERGAELRDIAEGANTPIRSMSLTGAIKSYRGVRRQLGREFLTVDAVELGPEASNPPEEVFRIVPAHEIAVGDVEPSHVVGHRTAERGDHLRDDLVGAGPVLARSLMLGRPRTSDGRRRRTRAGP